MISLAEVLQAPWGLPRDYEVMMLTLYKKPRDWPRFYVIRAMYVRAGGEVRASHRAAIFRTEEEARDWIAKYYPALEFKGKHTDNEPQILGVWM